MITAEQRQIRQKYIGSSDAAAICGVDKYRTAADVYLEKTGRVEPFAGNAATDRGALLEPVILDWAELQLGEQLERDVLIIADNGALCANLDGRAGKRIVEAKSSVIPEAWGEPGTDAIPDEHNIQVHHQMGVAGLDEAYVAVLLPGFRSFDFRLYHVPVNRELRDFVCDRGIEFMDKFIRRDTPPPDSTPTIEVMKRMRRVPAKAVPIPDELADQFIVAQAAAKRADSEFEEAKRMILAAIGDGDAGSYSAGRFTYFEINRKGYEVAPTSYRQLKLQKNK